MKLIECLEHLIITRAVVFDLDETLIDRKGSLDGYARALWNFFRAESVSDEERFLAVFHQLDGNGRVPRPDFFARLSEAAFDGVAADQIADHFRACAWVKPILFEGIVEVINTFKANAYAVGVVTNGGSHSQNAKITNSGLIEHFDAYVISEEFGVKKPDPAIYAEIARRLDVDPATSWFVGDDPISDVVGPAQFGFNSAWIERYIPWPDSQQRCYQHRLSHVSELSDALFGPPG